MLLTGVEGATMKISSLNVWRLQLKTLYGSSLTMRRAEDEYQLSTIAFLLPDYGPCGTRRDVPCMGPFDALCAPPPAGDPKVDRCRLLPQQPRRTCSVEVE